MGPKRRVGRTRPGFTVELRHGAARYEVVVENPDRVCGGVAGLTVDGEAVALAPRDVASLALSDDGRTHRVEVRLAAAGPR